MNRHSASEQALKRSLCRLHDATGRMQKMCNRVNSAMYGMGSSGGRPVEAKGSEAPRWLVECGQMTQMNERTLRALNKSVICGSTDAMSESDKEEDSSLTTTTSTSTSSCSVHETSALLTVFNHLPNPREAQGLTTLVSAASLL
eukprot:TRINITY_DN16248_c2_g2_i1.p1 TRINITY_DN16248_c2_g2~~TRINITY_DN16248_c2_g2_i1.p1  ORF type:complete len:144 (+),score=10.18 TRINITY_DN16248_c2_g2_i1:97-528(+)